MFPIFLPSVRPPFGTIEDRFGRGLFLREHVLAQCVSSEK
jgi:hypothetical protein